MRTLTSRACGALLLSVSLSALSVPAFAQDAAAAPEAEDDGDIVVIAQGREQLLSDVPVAVSAVSAEVLQNSGANDIRQLNQVAPSLLVSSTGSEANGSARIRGIGTVGDNPGLESSVAVFVDGVYRSRSGIGLNELGEIERVEVLRGPQGTLGGRNASAGMINIISRRPSFTASGNYEITYGNFDYLRVGGSVTGPISDTLAMRVDAISVRRDGFYYDPQNDADVNDRDRWFARGQLLWQPSDAVSLRLIGDWSRRSEACCAATYVDNTVNEYIGDLNNPSTPLTPLQPTGNNIINVLRDLGQPIAGFNPGYDRTIYVTRGRNFNGLTEDRGVSAELTFDFGNASLTSITGYRAYDSSQASDTDYSRVDILYRDEAADTGRSFRTFTQELRLQGEAFDGRLDWLVGAFFADEDLSLVDNLRFGSQYGRFANCRIISGGGLAAVYSPTSPSCAAAQPAVFGAASTTIWTALSRLDTLNSLGSTRDRYSQNSRNWAVFTHNIIEITDQFDLTLGVRYTNERKLFDATFGNNNTVCTANQAALSPLLTGTLAATAGAIIGLSCQGNSTAELNGVSINSRRSEDEFTGTAIASYRPNEDWLFYLSYARGYKAGGFNLDRSALKSPIASFASVGGAQSLVGNLQFDPEIVDAYEFGIKYATRPLTISLAIFRQDFQNFQLNTFNGTVFLVQTVNGCGNLVGGPDSDRDASAATGTCAAGDVGWGVRSEGIELEAVLNPTRDIRVGLGLTYTNTRYANDLVGNISGAPLDPALRFLPGDNLSNAPELVATTSFTWTPPIGSNGMTGLVYFDARMTGDYNTGSDLFPQKEQDGYTIVNARLGLRGEDQRWSLEFWAQNLFNTNYAQVAFNTPFQAGTTSAPFTDAGNYPGGRQLFSQFLAEPRTFGATVRFGF